MSSGRSLTKSVFFLSLAKSYLEDWRRDCVQLDKELARKWGSKVESTLNDIYCSMTPQSREQYLSECKNADILVYDELFRLMLMMDSNQRELLETVANGIVNGELIEFSEK